MIETKVCSNCNEEKELSEYYSQRKYSKKKGYYIYYNPDCKECTKSRSLIRHHEHKDENNENNRQWRKTHKKEISIYLKGYKEEHAEYTLKQKEWRQNNPDKSKSYNIKYSNKKHEISTKQWRACKNYFNNCCAYCGILETEAKTKYNRRLNKEHAINKGANDLSNCIPSCTGCNSSKHENDYNEWYVLENPIYDENKLNLINKWLQEDYKKFL